MKRKKLNILSITPISKIPNVVSNLNKIGRLTQINDPKERELKNVIYKYDIIFTNPNKTKIYLNSKVLSNANKLKIICTASTGTNHIDLEYCKKNKIRVISLRKELKILKKISSTSELTFALSINLIRKVNESNQDVIKGNWDYEKFVGRQLNELSIGIIGYGRLGKIVSNYFLAFKARVFVYDPNITVKSKNIIQVRNLNKLLSISDLITLHIHVDKNNINFINKSKLDLMKRNVILINTSRGEVINDKDLISFLKKNPAARLGADVLINEKDLKNNLLYKFSLKSSQVLITPHIGGMSSKAQFIAYNHAVKLLAKEAKKYKNI